MPPCTSRVDPIERPSACRAEMSARPAAVPRPPLAGRGAPPHSLRRRGRCNATADATALCRAHARSASATGIARRRLAGPRVQIRVTAGAAAAGHRPRASARAPSSLPFCHGNYSPLPGIRPPNFLVPRSSDGCCRSPGGCAARGRSCAAPARHLAPATAPATALAAQPIPPRRCRRGGSTPCCSS